MEIASSIDTAWQNFQGPNLGEALRILELSFAGKPLSEPVLKDTKTGEPYSKGRVMHELTNGSPLGMDMARAILVNELGQDF